MSDGAKPIPRKIKIAGILAIALVLLVSVAALALGSSSIGSRQHGDDNHGATHGVVETPSPHAGGDHSRPANHHGTPTRTPSP